jgi:hypothetical protein
MRLRYSLSIVTKTTKTKDRNLVQSETQTGENYYFRLAKFKSLKQQSAILKIVCFFLCFFLLFATREQQQAHFKFVRYFIGQLDK